jgi:acyl-CoA thioester hydrolase
MASAQPFVGRIQEVEPQWIDYNGHLNMAYYHVLFDRAVDEMMETVGLGPDYVRSAEASYFTVEAHVVYARELHAGDRVRIASQLLDLDSKRVHYLQQMFHAEEGWLACLTENLVLHVDMKVKRAAPFPPRVFGELEALLARHRTLPVPPQVGRSVGIARKTS